MRQEKFTPKWILDLMGQIQMTLKKEDDGLDTALFYCEILFVSLIALAGVNHICDRKESLIDGSETNKSLFSEAVSIISAKPMWKEITPQVKNIIIIYLKNLEHFVFFSHCLCLNNTIFTISIYIIIPGRFRIQSHYIYVILIFLYDLQQ